MIVNLKMTKKVEKIIIEIFSKTMIVKVTQDQTMMMMTEIAMILMAMKKPMRTTTQVMTKGM